MEIWGFYQFCPRCGVQASSKLASHFTCGTCGFVRYFNPACAVAALVFDPNGRLLLIRRAREPAKGKLAMPGGFIDCGESAEAALRREIMEEIGLALDRLDYLGSWPNRYPTPGGEVNVCDFFFTTRAQNTDTNRAADEVTDIVWIDPRHMRPHDLTTTHFY